MEKEKVAVVVAHTHNPSTWETKAEESQLECNLGYIGTPCLKNKGRKIQGVHICPFHLSLVLSFCSKKGEGDEGERWRG
jgi:hypothetical protein